MKGRCWRCNQEGHSGRSKAHIRKVSCAAFKSVCQQCNAIGHYTSVCKKGNRREQERADEASDVGWPGMNPTTKAFVPRNRAVEESTTHNREALAEETNQGEGER